MNPDTLIQRGNPGYSKQQKQLREASSAPAPTAPATVQNTQVATTIGGSSYNAGGGKINPYNQPITSASMTPATTVVLPTPTTPTTTAPVEAAVNASTANVTKANEAATAAGTAPATTQSDNLAQTMRDVLGIQEQITTETASIDRAAQDKARMEADQYTSQIEQEALAARRATEALQKNNPQGLFGGALQDEVNRINRDSLSKQADLAILQNSALRNFDTAKSIADRQLELKLEPLKTKLENLKFFYSENKDILTKADDRAYSELIKAKDREYKKIEDTETQLNEIKKNVAQYAGADAANIINQLSKIDSKSPDAVSKALTLAGKYQSDPLDRAIKNAQLSKLNADISKTMSEISATTGPGNNVIVSDINTNPTGYLANVIKSSGAKASANIETALGVIESAKLLAEKGANGFKGIAPVRLTPGVFKSKDQIETQALVDAINLKVQQWASGASLTEVQTKQVARLTPDKNDTDKQIRSKINNLSNFMAGQVKSSLAKEGKSVEIPQIDLFTAGSKQTEDDYLNTVEQTLSTVNSPYSMYLNE